MMVLRRNPGNLVERSSVSLTCSNSHCVWGIRIEYDVVTENTVEEVERRLVVQWNEGS
jgi:hypothetical protein